MMTASEDLERIWAEVGTEGHAQPGYYRRRLVVNGARVVHAGMYQPGNVKCLLMELPRQALGRRKVAESTRGYHVDTGTLDPARESIACIFIREAVPGRGELFPLFCTDLIRTWSEAADDRAAVQALRLRLDNWRRFFQRSGPAGLSREEYIGLFGELQLIHDALARGINAEDVLHSWMAPEGSNQDFHFGSVAVEVKTVTANDADRIAISNIRQLDGRGAEFLFLRRYAFDVREGTGQTLPALLNSLMSAFEHQGQGLGQLLLDRILERGYVPEMNHAMDEQGFSQRMYDAYQVTDGFPRITEDMLMGGITDVSYSILLSSAADKRVNDDQFWTTIRNGLA
jgi:hypothetical protein